MRTLLLAFAAFYLNTPTVLTGEPRGLVVIVPDAQLATELSAKVPGIQVAILQFHPGETYESMNARALALRDATYLIVDHAHESRWTAMFRERLQDCGVTPIKLQPMKLPQPPISTQSTFRPSDHLVNMLNRESANNHLDQRFTDSNR